MAIIIEWMGSSLPNDPQEICGMVIEAYQAGSSQEPAHLMSYEEKFLVGKESAV
jgi:hypothetical protein